MNQESEMDIPIAIFIFKRVDKTKRIINRIAEVKPKKIYIISDGPRNDYEIEIVKKCREMAEKAITWDCEVIKNYSEKNRGVYENIGLGAKWVFEREEMAIFLEDDNLPDLSFFTFCQQLLHKFKDDEKIMWICGTNYLEKYENEEKSSYVFTQHLLPCGWASWSKKFLKYYDGDLNGLNEDSIFDIQKTYSNKKLYKQQSNLMIREKKRIEKHLKPISWDYQMEFSIRKNNLFGISPTKNLIENIGVDEDSIHGGTSYNNIMTERFCSMKTYPLNFPLVHPSNIEIDSKYEKKINKIILYPLRDRLKQKISMLIRNVFRIESENPLFYKLRKK